MIRLAFTAFLTCLLMSMQGLKAQNFGLGGAAIYNFQTESIGFELRGSFMPDQRLSIVPQVTYYPSFNAIHEFYIGLGAEYDLWVTKHFQLYALGHGSYNGWVNYEESAWEHASYNNINLEGGLGICGTGCWRPFIEARYNARFKTDILGESNVRVGVLYVFGCSSGNGHGKATHLCPAYN